MSLSRVVPFQGDDYQYKRDGKRLGAQLQRVFDVMKDGKWRSHEELRYAIWCSTDKIEKGESISRQVRYLKTVDGCDVERRYDGHGLYRYRLVFTTEQRGLGL